MNSSGSSLASADASRARRRLPTTPLITANPFAVFDDPQTNGTQTASPRSLSGPANAGVTVVCVIGSGRDAGG